MGFLDSLRGGKAQPLEEQIVFSELPDWVEDRKTYLERNLEERLSPYRKKLPEAVKGVRERLEELQKANVKKELQQRIDSIVTSSRDNYVSGMEKVLLGINVSENPMELSENLMRSLTAMKELDLKYSDRVGFGFPEQLSKMKKELNKLVDLANSMNASLGEMKSKLTILSELEGEVKTAGDELERIKRLEDRRSDLVSDTELTKADMQRKEDEIERLETSDRAERVDAMKTELADLSQKRLEIENSMLNVLGPLKRAFKMYARAASEGKANGGFSAEKYAEDPVGIYLRGDNTLPDLLAGVQKALQARILETDNVEIDKTLKKIRNISFSYTDKLRSEYTALISTIRGLDVRIAELDIAKDTEKLKRDIDSLKDRIAANAKEIEKLETEIKDEGAKVHGIKIDLTTGISAFVGRKINIV